MTRSLLYFPLTLAICHGQIVINEISASAAERNLRWDGNDQPFAGAGPAWWSPSFNDDDWESGTMPIGYSLGSISTNLSGELSGVSPSFFVRKEFTVSGSDASLSDPLVLSINYDDGFIAWVNGVEVARRNMGEAKAHIYHDQLTYRASTLGTGNETISLGIASDLLLSGNNALAIQVNNNALTGDMRLDMSLKIDRASGSDPQLFNSGSPITYIPGLDEPSADLVEPALRGEGPSDWIELHNIGAAPVNLNGWTLTDDPQLLSKWSFPDNTAIEANGYLVILADNPDNPIPGASYLHANFKLSGSGDYIGLFDSNTDPVSVITPDYPPQFANYSYGRDASGEMMFLAEPTPGAVNSTFTFVDKADAPDFDNKGGFYDQAVTVTLTSQTPSVTIRYTTDGTAPTLENGIDYTTPLNLAQITNKKGHVIRARAFRDGFIPSNIKTNTFLIGQDARLRTSPSLIYAGDPQRSLYDPFGVMAINGGTYSGNQWQPSATTDYNNVINRGRAYERPIHAEFYFADGTVGFRSNVGLRVASSSYSRPRMTLNNTASSPWAANPTQKPSFNLYFRDDYGNPSVNLPLNGPGRTVDDYQRFRVRAGKNDISNPFVIDELFRRLSHEMGNGASLGVNNSLYVNGELKGFYNMVERLREPFFQSLHSDDPNNEWDVLQFEGNDNIAEGDKVAWDDMITRLNASTTTANWEAVLAVADVANMADYYLLNIYGATWDWPHNNWVAAKERSAEGRYRLYVWDAEGGMNNRGPRTVSQEMINTYILGSANGQAGQTGTEGEMRDLWRGLNRWEEFRILFADRIHKHLFNGGVLDDRDYPSSVIKQEMDQLVDEFSDLLSFMNNQTVQTSKVTSWTSSTSGRRRYLLGPTREEFRDNQLWPEVTPPNFSKFGGSVSQNFPLLITTAEGDFYYTTDGSDPRLSGGNPNPSAISQAGAPLDASIIPLESTWSYSDADGDLGTEWKSPAFDDSSWDEGNAPLGYGSIRDSGVTIPIATEVNNTIPRQPTTYFRKTFQIAEAQTFLDLEAQLRIDGGAIVYLNGVEVIRESNLPATVTYITTPSSDSSDGNEGDLTTFPLDATLLVNGANTIAVELHNSPTSSDMIMDIALKAKQVNLSNLPITISEPVTVKARTLINGTWSALTEANFTIESIPADSTNLAIAEMLYNPSGPSAAEIDAGFDDGDDFEFLRIENTGNMTIDLSDVRFTSGISYDFSSSQIITIAPQGIAILVSNLDAFRFRFGNSFDSFIAGQYSSKLANGGELLRIVGIDDSVIHEFTYSTESPWPDLSASDGHSILIKDTAAGHGAGSNWKTSEIIGGSPDGTIQFDQWVQGNFSAPEQADPTVSGPNADPDGDGWSNLFEFAFGSAPTINGNRPSPLEATTESIGNDQYFVVSYTRAGGRRSAEMSADISSDLDDWSAGGIPMAPDVTHPDGSVTSKFRHPDPIGSGKQFMRLRVSQ
ncbi:lamin tail domain-containing protein [Akkermansiaceae bacterium]|nr:lamin tail domain-containing protein [Akkermansiaceae bacterium]